MAPADEDINKMDEEVDDENSDVDMEGMDMDEDEEGDVMEDEEDEESNKAASSEGEGENESEKMVQEDNEELEEARKERMELMEAERKKIQKEKQKQDDNNAVFTPQQRLEYILAQSDVFAHFLAGSVAASSKKGKGKGRSAGKKGRLTEAEEDAQMLKSAQSKRRTVRLDKQPSNLADHCKMHKYQLEGLNWLIKLHDNGINGILADEMGLGKTLQTISLLAYLRESRGVKGPHICIVPKSVVGNWIRELKRWCPAINCTRMGGTKVERQKFVSNYLPHKKDPNDPKEKGKFDVVVASYEAFLKEKGKLGKVNWNYLIIDEAHRIKNENSSLSKAVRIMNTKYRMLITGTPLQNNLRELWALLNFLLPDIFGDAEQFDAWFSLEDKHGKENVIKKLHTILRPFMLRRVKKDVATALPPKKETKLYIGLTKMQQEWYVKVLQKDAHELNKLGGPDRVRLLNVLMQLRKVCNHPYLFDGAEHGPPYIDGPHLWENSGKMQLLHKLLLKLKQKGSRVLIFCQMTRVLDILEDYFRLIGYKYCRLDGNTDGEKRDSQMDEFNAEGSEKFAFLLSTRAGGLGINLATADIVILYDSDWNPQVDLQAMDRAHRIGQKKPVQVFRFISEGTVEEKIIERADRKLFLDAAVIQQGRIAEQHKSLEKDELMKMVRFGADQILSGKGGTYTDEDIDALIAKGEERTSEIQAKLQKDAKHNLANFSLMAEDETGRDTFSFDGKNYRGSDDKNTGNFINLPQRQRKRNYDVNEYFRETMNAGSERGISHGMKAHAADAAAKKRRKGPALHDFQLFNIERINFLNEKERTMALKKENQVKVITDLRARAEQAPSMASGCAPGVSREELRFAAQEAEDKLDGFKLSSEEESEKNRLLAEGFPDWNRKDFKSFTTSLERHGRYDFKSISHDVLNDTGKTLQEIQKYFVAFWTNYQRINDWKKILDKIEKGERKILRLRQIRDAIQEKVERHLEDTFGAYYNQNLKFKDANSGNSTKDNNNKKDSETTKADSAVNPSASTTKEDENGDKNANKNDISSKGDAPSSGNAEKTMGAEEVPSATELLHYSWPRIRINYGQSFRTGRAYQDEEDAFLVYMMHRHGYGAVERIRMEIRRAWQFRFDWYFKSRSASEIQKRCDLVVKFIERENEEILKKEQQEQEQKEEELAKTQQQQTTQQVAQQVVQGMGNTDVSNSSMTGTDTQVQDQVMTQA